MMRVTVIGDALLDVMGRPHEPMRTAADTSGRIRLGPGGQGANVAVRLARRGVEVDLVAAIGDDPAGALVRSALEADAVRLRAVPADSTGIVIVLLEPDAERTMVSQRAAFADAAADTSFADADWVVVSGYLFLEPEADPLVAAVVASAARRALLGCAVPADAVARWRSAAATLGPELLVLNADEAGRLGASPAAVTVVTDPAGATAYINGATVRVLGEAGPPALDTTGAGDAFAAMLLAELPATWPPDESAVERAVRAALDAAGAVTRVEGAQARISDEPDRYAAQR